MTVEDDATKLCLVPLPDGTPFRHFRGVIRTEYLVMRAISTLDTYRIERNIKIRSTDTNSIVDSGCHDDDFMMSK
jgi:hypothetical protein